jgi:translation initiation factor 1
MSLKKENFVLEIGAKLEGDCFDTQKEDKNKPKKEAIMPKNQHQLIFHYEKRKGKPVTLVGRFYCDEKEKKEVLKLLKKKLACGGAIKEEFIELQGDVKAKVKEILQQQNWKFK